MNNLDIIERFRFSHHNVAMMFAAGLTVQEISKRTGFTPRRLMMLLDDPTFCELIEHYREPHVESLLKAIPDAIADMEFVRSASVRHLRDKFERADEEGADEISIPNLIKIHDTMADRTGFSKHTIRTNLNVSFAAQLDRARERSDTVRVIEGETIMEPLTPAKVPVPRTFRRV
jgi:hypothetical protein